jgi:hypothetical protein
MQDRKALRPRTDRTADEAPGVMVGVMLAREKAMRPDRARDLVRERDIGKGGCAGERLYRAQRLHQSRETEKSRITRENTTTSDSSPGAMIARAGSCKPGHPTMRLVRGAARGS